MRIAWFWLTDAFVKVEISDEKIEVVTTKSILIATYLSYHQQELTEFFFERTHFLKNQWSQSVKSTISKMLKQNLFFTPKFCISENNFYVFFLMCWIYSCIKKYIF